MMNKGYKGEIAIYTEKKEPEQEDCKNNCQICDSAKETNNKVTCKYVFFFLNLGWDFSQNFQVGNGSR